MRKFSKQFDEDLEGYGILCGYVVVFADPKHFKNKLTGKYNYAYGHSLYESGNYVVNDTYKEYTIALKNNSTIKDVNLFFKYLDFAESILEGEFWLTNLGDTSYAFYQETEDGSWHVRSIPEVPEFLKNPILI